MSIRNVVVPTDFSAPSRAALHWAMRMAGLDGAALHLVHAETFPAVASPYGVTIPSSVWEAVRRATNERMDEFREEASAGGIAPVTTNVAGSNDPLGETVNAVERHRADLVVVGTHGYSGLKHAVLGSVTERILQRVPCPVMVVKEEPKSWTPQVRQIFVPVDFSEHSKVAVAVATELAIAFGARLEVFHAIDFAPGYTPYFPPEASELQTNIELRAQEQLEALREGVVGLPEEAQARLVRGPAARAILEESERIGADLMVMGSHGRSGLARWTLGSTTERTVRKALCPVIVVKADSSEE